MKRAITVVGGGYAGLSFIRQVCAIDPQVSITLIDRNPFHTMLTETHQVAAGSRTAESILIPFDQLADQMGGFRFIQAEVTGLEPAAHQVMTTEGPVDYEQLVVALGSVDHDFGVKGVAQWCMTLRSINDALAIREKLQSLPPDAPVVIAGGGLTGVELAAHVANNRPKGRTLTLVEASPTLLPGMPAELIQAARRRLGHLGVNIITGAPVAQVEDGLVHLADGTTLPFGMMVWACGIKANPLLKMLGVPLDRGGRVILNDDLSTPLPDVFVIGDAAAGHLPSAQAASQHGHALALRVAGRPTHPIRMKGTLVDLAQHRGVARVGSMSLRGLLPGVMKWMTEALWVFQVAGLRAALRLLPGGRPLATRVE